jgi:uncharacterized protein (TIGR02145 family)
MDTVKIGNQIWQTKNLSVNTLANGDKICHAQTSEDWEMVSEKKMPAWCFYDDDEENEPTYGRLYNWYAVTDPRGLAPIGFKIPSEQDWNELIESLGGEMKAGLFLKGDELYWNFDDEDAAGFLALPGGVCNEYGSCYDKGDWGCWWSSTESDNNEAYAFHLSNEFEEAGFGFDQKNWALSVRCLAV